MNTLFTKVLQTKNEILIAAMDRYFIESIKLCYSYYYYYWLAAMKNGKFNAMLYLRLVSWICHILCSLYLNEAIVVVVVAAITTVLAGVCLFRRRALVNPPGRQPARWIDHTRRPGEKRTTCANLQGWTPQKWQISRALPRADGRYSEWLKWRTAQTTKSRLTPLECHYSNKTIITLVELMSRVPNRIAEYKRALKWMVDTSTNICLPALLVSTWVWGWGLVHVMKRSEQLNTNWPFLALLAIKVRATLGAICILSLTWKWWLESDTNEFRRANYERLTVSFQCNVQSLIR